ncbi:hypothetical protein N7486_003948 [Penicillium sp. IBT 16267x]|nr:hypothetical protein N7486_003948 [Penicillium sp. IBT 16267x]
MKVGRQHFISDILPMAKAVLGQRFIESSDVSANGKHNIALQLSQLSSSSTSSISQSTLLSCLVSFSTRQTHLQLFDHLLINHRAVSTLSSGALQPLSHIPLICLELKAFAQRTRSAPMANANIDINQSRRKISGSLNSVQHEIDVLHQMYERLQAEHSETEAELKRAQERIQFLEAENDSNVTQAMQIIKSGEIDDQSLSARLNEIYDILEAWSRSVVPVETDLSEKWPSISHYLTSHRLIQPGNNTFNNFIKGTEPEMISAIIMAVLSETFFLNVVAGMLPDQALVLRQLQNNIQHVQPDKSKNKILELSFL